VNPLGTGLLFRNPGQVVLQIVSLLGAIAYAFTVTWELSKVVDATVRLRLSEEQEVQGLDVALHDERAYNL
jgi:ammonium transporter, Amt family